MADTSTKGFIIMVLSIAGLIYPADWFFGLLTVALFALVGWTVMGIAGEIDSLNTEIQELKRELVALEGEVDDLYSEIGEMRGELKEAKG